MASEAKEAKRQQRKRKGEARRRSKIVLCNKKEIETGVWVEFPTEKLWKRRKTSPRSVDVELELTAVDDLKPRRMNLTANHKPIISQATVLPNKKNKFSVETVDVLGQGDKIRLKIDASRIFKWKTSLTLSVKKEGRKTRKRIARGEGKEKPVRTRFCLDCGSFTLIGAKFCHRCGAELGKEITAR